MSQVSSSYWPYAFPSERPLAWGTLGGGHSQRGWEWPLSSVLCWMRPFHTWSSKRLSELPREPVRIVTKSNTDRLVRGSLKSCWKINKLPEQLKAISSMDLQTLRTPNLRLFSSEHENSSENPIKEIPLRRVLAYISLHHHHQMHRGTFPKDSLSNELINQKTKAPSGHLHC